jgi:hypothetical protein
MKYIFIMYFIDVLDVDSLLYKLIDTLLYKLSQT